MAGKQYPGWAFLLAGLLIGLFIAFLFYLQQQPAIEAPSLKETADQVKALREAKAQQQKPKAPKTDFDFYKILPELEVVVPDFDQKPKVNDKPSAPKNDTPASAVSAPAAADYLLQVGSFGDRSQAEQFKAKLALLGLQAGVQAVSINGKNWYRVRLGPYSNRTALLNDQKRLNNNQIKSIVLQLKD